MKTGRVMRRVCAAALLAAAATLVVGLPASGCRRAWELGKCRSAAEKVCAKWFLCWPLASTATWIDEDYCKAEMSAWCADATADEQCDLTDEDLADCESNIDGSPCGSLPASCTEFENCYEESESSSE